MLPDSPLGCMLLLTEEKGLLGYQEEPSVSVMKLCDIELVEIVLAP